MSADIVDLATAKAEREPHRTGEARCLACRYTWTAIASVGVIWLACPACTLTCGRFVNCTAWNRDHWHCHCGNDLFHATHEGMYCPNCGDFQKAF